MNHVHEQDDRGTGVGKQLAVSTVVTTLEAAISYSKQ